MIYSEVYTSHHIPCVSASDLEEVNIQIEQNLFYLQKKGISPVYTASKQTVLSRWPLKLSGETSDLPYNTVGPYFDLDKNFNRVLDFECGSKTYDGHTNSFLLCKDDMYHFFIKTKKFCRNDTQNQ